MDGGAVFGAVPRVLWEKLKVPDAHNRIPMATNCMLVRTPDANILVEAGIGPKLTDKERDNFAFDRKPGLPAALSAAGLRPEDIDLVVLSHLHFDHCGALVAPGQDGELAALFLGPSMWCRAGSWRPGVIPTRGAAHRTSPKTSACWSGPAGCWWLTATSRWLPASRCG